jgi:hypothetical protein
LRGFFGDFFGSVAAASVDSTAANAADGVSDAAGEGGSARAGSVEADAPSVAGAGVAGFETTHIGASWPLDLDVFAAADVPGFLTTHRGGGSERAACLNSGAMIEGGVEPDGLDVTREVCDRTLPVISGAAVVAVEDVRALAVTRDAGSERTTNAVPDGWTVLPEDS